MRKLNAQHQRQRRRRSRRWRRGVDAAAVAAAAMSSANASITAPAENFMAALRLAVEMLKEPAYPETEFDRIMTQRFKALENVADRAHPACGRNLATGTSARSERATSLYAPTREEQLAELQQGHPGRRARSSTTQFYGANYGVFAVVGPVDPAAVRRPRPSCSAAGIRRRPTSRLSRRSRRPRPINEKIETPDKANAQFEAGVRFKLSETRSGLSGDGAGGLHVRRADHVARLRPHPQPRRAELRRERAHHGPRGRRFGDAVRDREPEPGESGPKVEFSFMDELARSV